MGTQWDPIHRCLTEGELDPTGGDFPLNTAILGGKQLHQGDDLAAVLIRPDMINFVAEALAEVKQQDVQTKEEKVLRSERYFGAVARSFQLPMDIDPSLAKAKYDSGVLTLTLPKKTGGQAQRLVID